MIAGTHIAFSSALYLGGAALFEYQPGLVGWGLAAGAALLPDADLPTSKLGRVLFPVSTRLERTFGHRTLTHSLAAVVLVAALASPLLYFGHVAWFWAVIGGYWSHLWLDMMNPRGADLFWPAAVRVVFPGNPKYRMHAGSKAEMVLFVCLIGFAALLYPVAGTGVRAGLQQLLGNFEMAFDTFQKNAGRQWYTLHLEGTDNLSLEQVECDCPVVGVWRRGLIVLKGDQLRAVGESETAHNLFPFRAELIEGDELQVVSTRVDMRGRTLAWLLQQMDIARVHYISGEVRVGARLNNPVTELQLYRPVSFSGQVLRLHYARARDLEGSRYLALVGAEGELFVQYWLRPGDPPLEVAMEEPGEVKRIPEELRRFLTP